MAIDRGAAVTRSLLGYGVVAGPFYLVVGLTQALLRDGFDFQRHALSHLANGPGGWIQILNFILTGAMVIVAAVGFARVPAAGLRWTSRFLLVFGASMVLAAIFRADPVPGLPPGTPESDPATMTTHGMLHFAFGGLGFLSLAVSALLASRPLARRDQTGLARMSLVAGILVVVGFFAPAFVQRPAAAMLGLWTAVVLGFGWLTVVSRHVYTVSPSPNC